MKELQLKESSEIMIFLKISKSALSRYIQNRIDNFEIKEGDL